jgi:hypothetical protein
MHCMVKIAALLVVTLTLGLTPQSVQSLSYEERTGLSHQHPSDTVPCGMRLHLSEIGCICVPFYWASHDTVSGEILSFALLN